MNMIGLQHDLRHGPYSVYLFEYSDGRKYVGSTGQKPENRWKKGYNPQVTAANEREDGIDKVKKSVLRTGLNKQENRFFEPFYAAKHKAYTNGYNILPSGSSCAVLQIDKENFEPVARWDSAYQAEKALGIPHNNILEAIHGKKRHSAGGFYWCYANCLYLPGHLQRIMDKAKEKAATTAAECSTVAEKGDSAIDKEE